MLDASTWFTPAPHSLTIASCTFSFAFRLLLIEFTSIGSLGWCIFGWVTVISICFTYTALSRSITSSSILITHTDISLTPAPLRYLPKSFTPHLLPFSSPFVDIALYLPTYSLHSLPILFFHFYSHHQPHSYLTHLPLPFHHSSITPNTHGRPSCSHL